MTQEQTQEINVIQVSNNLIANVCKNMTNLAGMLEKISCNHPDSKQINTAANLNVANASKQIGSLGNLIEQMVNQMNFVEHNAQGGAKDANSIGIGQDSRVVSGEQ